MLKNDNFEQHLTKTFETVKCFFFSSFFVFFAYTMGYRLG